MWDWIDRVVILERWWSIGGGLEGGFWRNEGGDMSGGGSSGAGVG